MIDIVRLLLNKLNVFLFAFLMCFFFPEHFLVTVLCILFYNKWIDFTVLCFAASKSVQSDSCQSLTCKVFMGFPSEERTGISLCGDFSFPQFWYIIFFLVFFLLK